MKLSENHHHRKNEGNLVETEGRSVFCLTIIFSFDIVFTQIKEAPQ